MNELFDVSGKVIVVTGATGILAGGAAQYLQKNGAKVVYLGRNQERVNIAIAEAEAISSDCMGVTCDVLDEQGLEAAYSVCWISLEKWIYQRSWRKYAWSHH